MSPAKIAKLPEVNTRIDFAHYDRDLMAAAIFHETNRTRVKLGLKPFLHLPKLDDAADLQASTGALLAPRVSHHNPVSRPGNHRGPGSRGRRARLPP